MRAKTVDKSQHSYRMSRVRSKNTDPELRVRRAAHALGLRFRLHQRALPGAPDLVFARYRTVVLVHGCFWHRHRDCQRASFPKSRVAYWSTKFDKNIERDKIVRRKLKALGWRVFVVWECQTKDSVKLTARLRRHFLLP